MQSQKTTGYLILKVQFIVYFIFFLKKRPLPFRKVYIYGNAIT